MSQHVSSPSEGRKDDGGKLRYDLIPPEFLEQVALVLTYGAKKYADRNWEQGMDWSRPLGALYRHLNKWQQGEMIDPESHVNHLTSVVANAMFLLVYELRGTGNDNVHIDQHSGQAGDVQRGEEDRPEELPAPLGFNADGDLVWTIRSIGSFRGFEGKSGEVWSHFRPDVRP